ncbi:MAG: Lipid-A-disaccharide synthase [Firmicutes bacterium]|nr:Lipid-A-disaccharide synthase [Bacillota bacterium]
MLKVMLSVGEASGDLHGACVAEALKRIQPDVKMFGMGGCQMRDAGVEIIYDIADLGVIGFVEVIRNLPRLFRLRDSLTEVMDRERPDVLLIIDYPDFNIRLAKAAKKLGIPVVSYIPPSAWAWRRGRAKEVAKTVDRIAAIFPFEADVYQEAGANVVFVGNPSLDIVKSSMTKEAAYRHFNADPAKPVVLLMPGSRRQEIVSLLPVMLASAEKIREKTPECQFFLPLASTISREIMQNMVNGCGVPIRITVGNNYDLMSISDVAIAASGTATLETSLMGVPTIIVYKLAALTYFLGKFLVKIPYFGLPNIIVGRKIVPELLQDAVNAETIACEALTILNDMVVRKRILDDLGEVRRKLGENGAVDRVANVVLEVAMANHGGQQ